MSNLARPFSALLLTLALATGHLAECAGWLATPEARMACCSAGGSCPMHESDAPGSNSTPGASQAEADRCCAASEQGDPAPSPSGFARSVSTAVVPGPVRLVAPSTATPPDAWRRDAPAAAARLPRHLLLSVLLV